MVHKINKENEMQDIKINIMAEFERRNNRIDQEKLKDNWKIIVYIGCSFVKHLYKRLETTIYTCKLTDPKSWLSSFVHDLFVFNQF